MIWKSRAWCSSWWCHKKPSCWHRVVVRLIIKWQRNYTVAGWYRIIQKMTHSWTWLVNGRKNQTWVELELKKLVGNTGQYCTGPTYKYSILFCIINLKIQTVIQWYIPYIRLFHHEGRHDRKYKVQHKIQCYYISNFCPYLVLKDFFQFYLVNVVLHLVYAGIAISSEAATALHWWSLRW